MNTKKPNTNGSMNAKNIVDTNSSVNIKESSFEKFRQEDNRYLSNRKKTAMELGMPNLFDIVDQFGLYAGVQTIGKSLAVYELLKMTNTIPGNILEFGCWKGSNLLLMTKILKLLQPNTIKEVYGFESFEGLKTFSESIQP